MTATKRARYNGKVRPGPVPSPEEWAWLASCRDADPEIFFRDGEPGRPGGSAGDEAPALAYCADCRVRETCLGWALQNREKFGVWGGTTAAQRRRIFKQGGGGWR
jgi:WhiB family redox-sensing transcriptional regulator